MKPSSRRLILLCGLVPTLAVAVLSLVRPAFLTRFEYSAYDRLVRAATPKAPDSRIVIVDVDEPSLSTIGQWPWHRDTMAVLLGNIRALGAATIGVDVIFAEPDRGEGEDRHPDAALAHTLRDGRVVLGYALRFDGEPNEPGAGNRCVPNSLGLAVVQSRDDDDPYFNATGAVCSLPELTAAAGAQGFLNAAPDADGILRRAPLLLHFGEGTYPSLALATVAALTGTRDVSLRVEDANTTTLVVNGKHVPLDGKSNLLVKYRGRKHTFPYVSAADVMRGGVAPGAFAGKLVLVGTTALGTREVVATPLDTVFAGVEVQATIADNLLQGDFIGRPAHATVLEAQLVLVLGVLITLLVRRAGSAWGAAGAAVMLIAAWGGASALLSTSGAFLSPLYPSLGLAAAFAAVTVAGMTAERRRADRAGREKADSQRLMVQTLLSLTGIRDAETGKHSQRTQRYARALATQLATHQAFQRELTPDRIELFASLAPLHDIGKVGVPDRILSKPGRLTHDEMQEMRRHPEYGRDVIEKAEREAGVHDDVALTLAKDIVYTHHEKWNGQGYPQGLRGAAIPIPGRLMAVVDVYDALTTRRVYRMPVSHDEAVAIIAETSGTHFDPAVVEAFLEVSAVFEELSAEGQ
jgi:CHASE2 domain-containing sensor protein